MKLLKNQNGIALVTALMLTLVSLVIILSVLYLVTQGTKMSASQKRYHNVLEASYGGVDFYSKDILPRIITSAIDGTLTNSTLSTLNTQFGSVNLQLNTSNAACLSDKLSKSSSSWGASCTNTDKSANPKDKADLVFTLSGTAGQSGYTVYGKIVDTIQGNTSTSSAGGGAGLLAAGVVSSGAGGEGVISPGTHYPYYYTVEMQGEAAQNPDEKARLTVLYAY